MEDIAKIMREQTEQGQIVQNLILEMKDDSLIYVNGDSVVIASQKLGSEAYIVIHPNGETYTFWEEKNVPVQIDPEKVHIPRPKKAKGNNAKQVVINALRQHKDNLEKIRS